MLYRNYSIDFFQYLSRVGVKRIGPSTGRDRASLKRI